MPGAYPAAVFFDAYGTLIHFPETPSPFDVMAEAMRRCGAALPRARLDDALRREMAYFKQHYGAVRTAADLERLRLDDARVYVQALGGDCPPTLDTAQVADLLAQAFETRALPDARPAIDLLRAAGVRVGVLSNYSYLLPLVLAEVGLAPLLDPIVFSAQVGAQKPDPRIFAAAARAVGAAAADCVLIGDDPVNDVEGARRSGMPVVWIDRGGQPAPDGAAAARTLDDAARLAIADGWRSLSLTPPPAAD